MSYEPAEYISFALGGVLVVLVGALAYRSWKNSRVTPEERERRRRAALVAQGKINDATLVDYREHHVFYSYAVRGVEYTASQDVSTLAAHMPSDPSIAGPIAVKYDPKNPANSIVLAEDWSGFRWK